MIADLEGELEPTLSQLSGQDITKLTGKSIFDYFASRLDNKQLKHISASVDTNSLEYLIIQGFSIADTLLKARNLSAKLTNYKKLNDLAMQDVHNAIHPKFELHKTNRVYYNSPDLIKIDKVLIVPRDVHNHLFSVDVKQQEPYIFINMLNIMDIKELLKQEPDIYKAIYKKVFNAEIPDEATRTEIKQVWNSITYGRGRKALEKESKLVDGVKVLDYFNSIPQYKAYMNQAEKQAKKYNYNTKTYFNTVLNAGNIKSWQLLNSLLNLPVQGTAADILTFLVAKADSLDKDVFNLLYTRHDELILEVNGEIDAKEAKAYLQEQFTHQIDNWIPFSVNVDLLYTYVA